MFEKGDNFIEKKFEGKGTRSARDISIKSLTPIDSLQDN